MRISGRVQGVGFRYFVLRQADAMGVQGWVKNLPDGSVSCEAQAAPEVMDRFLELLREGPKYSKVARLEVDELPSTRDPSPSFQIR